jgi:hypothetical protein
MFDLLMESWREEILEETGGHPPYMYDPTAGVFSADAFSMAGAFSPNLSNPPSLVDFPMNKGGNILPPVMKRWRSNDPIHLVSELVSELGLKCGHVGQPNRREHHRPGLSRECRPRQHVRRHHCVPRIYFDVGEDDEFFLYEPNVAFAEALDDLGLEYEFQVFEGGHFDKFTERMPIGLAFLGRGDDDDRWEDCDEFEGEDNERGAKWGHHADCCDNTR